MKMEIHLKWTEDDLVSKDGEDERGKYKNPYKINKYWRVYEDGRVFSTYKKDFINESSANNGIRSVKLNGRNVEIHYLVALLYFPVPEDKNQKYVVFKDGNPENTHYENLAWHTDKLILEEGFAFTKDNYYVAEKNGNIYSVRNGVMTPRNLKPDSAGYLTVNVRNKKSSVSVHRLVYSAFHPDLGNSGIDHINRVVDDNRLENLRPATAKEQAQNRKAMERDGYKVLKCDISGKIILEEYVNTEDAILKNGFRISDEKFKKIIKSKSLFENNIWKYKNQHYDPDEDCFELIYDEEINGRYINYPDYFIYSSGVIVRHDRDGVFCFHSQEENSKYPFTIIEKDMHYIHVLLGVFFIPGRSEERNEVFHKDRNPKNYNLDNLEWLSASEIGLIVNGKPVKQLHPETGEIVAVFPSITEAQKLSGGNGRSKIGACINGTRKLSDGWAWEKCTQEEMEIFIENNNGKNYKEISLQSLYSGKKPVKQLDPKTKKVLAVFPSIKDAQEAGEGRSKIGECCNGKRKTAGGFAWEFSSPQELEEFEDVGE